MATPDHPIDKNTRYLFLINPNAGTSRVSRKKDLVAQVSRHLNATTVISESESHASRTAKDAFLAGDVVVACGGDGLHNLVAQQAVETGGVMSVLPIGRGNDFAASLQIRTAQDTEMALRHGTIHNARYVKARFADYSRISLTCAGVGLLSEAAFRASKLPVIQGRLLYTVAALISLMKLKCHRYTVSLDGSTQREKMLIFIGAASEYTGGGIHIAPSARSDPGKLNVLFATSVGKIEAVSLLVKALAGRHLGHPKVHNTYHDRCRLSCEADDFWASLVYGDGEYLGVLPVSFEIGHAPLRVLVPTAMS